MKDFGWLQNKVVSFVSFVVALVAICGWIVTVKLYAEKLNNISTKVEKIEANQEKQLEINGKIITLYDLLTK
jgi:hypothetical protein